MIAAVTRFRAALLAALLALAAGSAFADSPPPMKDDEGTSATATLEALVPFDQTDCYIAILNAQSFCYTCVPSVEGFGPVPVEALALNALLDRPDADLAMKALVTPGHSAYTRLWALCGLYFTDKAGFEAEAAGMKTSSASVEVQSGCVVWGSTLGEIVARGRGDDIITGKIPSTIRSLKSIRWTTCAPVPKEALVVGSPAAAKAIAALSDRELIDLPYEKTDCYATLKNARSFSWGLVGAGAAVPSEAIALNGLLDRPDSGEAMRDLFRSYASPATRLWALCGLYYIDDWAFQEGVKELKSSDESVLRMSGCTGFETKVSDLVFGGGSSLDIAHGGIPAAIRSMKSRSQATCAPASQRPTIADQSRSTEPRR